MLWERCLAMAFILRKPRSPCQITNLNLSGARGALQLQAEFDPFATSARLVSPSWLTPWAAQCQSPSIFTLYGNVRWQPSIILRTREHPAGIGFRNYFSVESRTHSTCSQVAGQTLVHQTFAEP